MGWTTCNPWHVTLASLQKDEKQSPITDSFIASSSLFPAATTQVNMVTEN